MEITQNKLIVKQKVEALEMITGLETKNKYKILTEKGNEISYAYEESNTFARIFLKRLRALKVNIIDKNNTKELVLEKGFAFFLPKFILKDKNNQTLATIKAKLKIVSASFEVYDRNNQLILICKNKVMHPWTFNIFNKNQENENQKIGLISKKFSGFGKEMFTDADNFLIDFKNITDNDKKQIILALSFAVDLYAFERR